MKAIRTNQSSPRHDRYLQERIHDPYKTPQKPPEPTICPGCGAVFHGGRWQWITNAPKDAYQQKCQACRRTDDGNPAGIVTLTGTFVHQHAAELIQLARHHEAQEKAAHPLHRIMNIEEHTDRLLISTTDIHLPHRIAEAFRHAYKGDAEFHYDNEGYFVRAEWRRDD